MIYNIKRTTYWMDGEPYGGYTKTFVGASGWREGLPIVTEDWANGTGGAERKRWSWTDYTQDDESKSYILNPRVTQSKIGDTGNVKRTEIDYRLLPNTNIAEYGLVSEVRLYDNGTNVLQKKSTTEYNLDSNYVSRRIIGLPSMSESWGLNQISNSLEKVSKVTFNYDEDNFGSSALAQNISPIQHDGTNFSSAFITGRGNLTSTTRHDVTGQTANVTTSAKYNTAGAAVEQTDAGNRKVEINYADSFNDGNNSRNTFAFPTKLIEVANTDTNNNFSEVKYRFDTGANVWAKSPKPENNSSGKETTRLYDEIGRLQKETLVNTGAYTRYEYPTNNIQSKVFSTVIDTNNNGADANDEVYAESWTDGAGRVRKARTEHPNSSGGWTGSLTEYDILGRVTRSTVPTEINSNYEPTGDDATRGWLWTQQEYDWKSRATRIIPSDSNGTDGKDQIISYEGCGCAGGQVTTVQGELVPRDDNPNLSARRTQKIYEDILGRTKKTEIYNWDATTVYTTTTQTFNGRDQVLKTRQYAGTTSSSTYQDVTMSYDGHGRMATRHYPIEDSGKETSWIYNSDDSISQVIDPRGAITNFSYNSRGLVSQISYSVPSPNQSNIPTTPTVNYSYDALGNRTQMTDGLGTQVYEYNPLSQLTAETRDFTDTLADAPNGVFRIEYGYNLSGGLKFYKDAFGQQIDYANDKTGKLTGVTGSTFGTGAGATTNYADTITYRAWGAIKSLFYRTNDNPHIRMSYDNRLRVNQHEIESYGREGNFVKKAAFSYLADGRVSAMDNQVTDEFDRSYKYDFIGRLTANQFGTTTTNPPVTPYAQTIIYDQFSQMTQRDTSYWGETGQFISSFTNGRESTTGVTGTTYDAAGNQINSGYRQYDVYQASKFDVANRRTEFTARTAQRSGRYSYIYTNRSTLQYYDGDGHALKQMEQINGTPLTDTAKYQIRSSVLNSYLTETTHTGAKRISKVFAGGAVIAEQTRVNYGNGNIDEVLWIHADPVSGSSERVVKSGAQYYRTEYEPLGNQEVSVFGLDEDFPEPQQFQMEPVGRAEDPQWQCQMADSMGLSFFSSPTHCQKAKMQADNFGPGIWSQYDPENIKDNHPRQRPSGGTATDPPVDETPTEKPQGNPGSQGAIAASSVGASGNDAGDCEYDAEGKPICRVQVMDNNVPGFIQVDKKQVNIDLFEKDRRSLSKDESDKLKKGVQSKFFIMNGDKTCFEKLNELLDKLGSNNTDFNKMLGNLLAGKEGLKLSQTIDPVKGFETKDTRSYLKNSFSTK
ncbi:MAG TPA: hypothetical protein PKE69_17740 [Pyrinomonadaceae bacterium]|nr:hypothetical protein [Pyrinomonadaceae bacterium]